MALILVALLSVHPFYDGNFSSLAFRTTSIFHNPAGLGLQPGSELTMHYDYHADEPDIVRPGIALRYFGFGWTRTGSFNYYEAGIGYKMPGIFSLGYAYQFGDSAHHKAGFISHPSQYLSLGYYTTVGEIFHMFGGISIRPYEDYVTLSCDIEYEGIDSIFDYHYGGFIQPVDGIKAHFFTNKDFHWKTGLEISFGQLKIAGTYAHEEKRISGGVILSAHPYKTFIPDKKKALILNLDRAYPEIDRKTFLGIPIKTVPGFTKFISDLHSLLGQERLEVIVVRIGDFSLGQAQTEEIGTIIRRLREQGKHIVFHADHYRGLLIYDLACAGDEIILSPLGSVNIPGLAMRKFYLAGTLEKLGIETDIASVGEYKSAAEIFSRTDMSESDREQLDALLDDLYYPVIEHIARSRGKTESEVELLINSIGFFNSDDALTHGLVDTVLYDLDINDYVEERYGIAKTVYLREVANNRPIGEPWKDNRPKIALVLAEGAIVSGEGTPDLFGLHNIGGSTYAPIFEAIRNDRSIRAVVFRINSGGGDAFASEKIATAVARCAEEKPVIVSMGDVAGSGGYYIACLADRVFADQRTITGSIGVFSLHIMTRGLYEKLGITWDMAKRGEHSDMHWGLRRLSDAEYEKELKESEWWYDKFTARVAQGRALTQERVDSLGRGRIYSGSRARNFDLIDEVGGFLEALEAAKEHAHIEGDVDIVVYPSRSGFSLFGDTAPQSRFLYLMPSIEIR